MTTSWKIETTGGPAARLVVPPVARQRGVRVLHPEERAVVLGSTQPESDVDRARAADTRTAVLRRRSGGGAVLVGPDLLLWTDVVIGTGDPLWTADVGRAFWWLGDLWAAALAEAGVPGAVAWHGGMVRSPWSDRVCFAGLGPGEVTVDGVKVVGMAQRRTREGAHFQCAVPVEWQPVELLNVLAMDEDTRGRGASELAGAAIGVGADVAARLVPAFLDRLP